MATKFLARTVVEGGRASWSKRERRRRNRSNRRWRLVDGEAIVARHYFDGRGFADRLVALHRWLRARCGRPWARVFAEFCRENNRQTMKGWHLHGHLAGVVEGAGFQESPSRYVSRFDYVVEGGILRQAEATWRGPYHDASPVRKENRAGRRRARRRNGSR